MDDNHLPVYGVGPYLIIPMLAITLLFSFAIKIPVFKVDYLNAPFLIIGVIFLVLGVIFWILSVVRSKITENILESNLITTGIYAYVRHPIYSAFLFVSTGLIFISNNLYLFILPIIFWALLSLVIINTEEKWLIEKFGNEYREYSQRVSRFIPILRI